MIGTTLLHYRILQALGSGGMGEVYAAEDTKLHRRVALKVLPSNVAADPERLQRFRREAQAVALLNHPNVVTLYAVEEAGDVHFLTMELVDGKTLGELTPGDGWSPPEFLKLAVPLADAVGTAHQRGIIHRDLKPANIMLSADGRLKVLDFGLAKLMHEETSAADISVLTTEQLTEQHRILGTAAYMSPEQAEGRALDHRTDIFSLGVVLYEMASGRRPFRGDTAISVISSIIKDSPPPLAEVNRRFSGDLDRIIGRCLAKDPARRYQSVMDLRADLEEVQQRGDSGEGVAATSRTPAAGARQRGRRIIGIAAAGALIAVAAYVLVRRNHGGDHAHPSSLRATFSQLTAQPGVEWFPSLSPDGKWVAYAGEVSGNRDIYLQSVNGQNPMNLTKDSLVEDDQPAFSPDGERIAFRSSRDGGGIFVMGRTGEAVRRVTSFGFKPAWSPDGARLAFTTQNGTGNSELWLVGANGGEPQRLGTGDAVHPSWSPSGRRIAYAVRQGGQRQLDVWTIPSAGGAPTAVTADPATDWNPVWAPDGKHLYFLSNRSGSMNLWRVPIDEESGKTLGEAEPITTPAPFVAHLSISADGRRLAYSSVLKTANIQKLALEPSTGEVKGEPVWVTTGSRSWSSPDPSPDGQWVAFYSLVQPEGDLYVVHPDGTGLRQVTSDSAIDRVPRWSPDGKWIVCFSNRTGLIELWKSRPDGSELQQVTEAGDIAYPVFSPDGSRLAASALNGKVYVFDPNRPWKEQQARVLPPYPRGRLAMNSWSPDGRRLAGQVGESMIGIVTYSFASDSFEQMTDYGEWPVWLPDSRRLLFVSGGKKFLILDTQSKRVREIFSVGRDVIGPPRLTRDGREAYYSRRVTEADIWLMTLQ
jgi:Tol biopolymer transport system component